MRKFVVIAYDKDNDVYEELYSGTDFLDVFEKAKEYGEQCRNGTLRRSDNGEPFDWVQLENKTASGKPLWISN